MLPAASVTRVVLSAVAPVACTVQMPGRTLRYAVTLAKGWLRDRTWRPEPAWPA